MLRPSYVANYHYATITMVISSTQLREQELDNFDGQLTQTVVLSPISWLTYQSILADLGDHRSTRAAYNKGVLTLKVPSKFHEIVNRLLARIAEALTEELGLEVVNIGSTTLDRDDLEKGAEPDTGFYIQNAAKLEGLDPEIPQDLPPDLIIEVDITSPSTQRMAIYQALGVNEIWRYTKRYGLKIYQLDVDSYKDADVSNTFPVLSAAQLNLFLQQRQTLGENQVIRAVREWVRKIS